MRNHFFQKPKRIGRPGFVAMDMLVGLIIICSVAVMLATTVRRAHAAESELADSRCALRFAEHVLLNLQHKQAVPSLPAEMRLSLHRAAGGIAPAGFVWATVDVSFHRHSRSLTGIVPTASILLIRSDS
jgi:hypothetical protein